MCQVQHQLRVHSESERKLKKKKLNKRISSRFPIVFTQATHACHVILPSFLPPLSIYFIAFWISTEELNESESECECVYERSRKALQHRHIKYIDSDTFLSGSRSTFRKLCYLKAAVCRLLPFLVVGVSVYMSLLSVRLVVCRFVAFCVYVPSFLLTHIMMKCFTRHIDERARASVPANTAYNSVHINFHYTDPKQCVLHLYFFSVVVHRFCTATAAFFLPRLFESEFILQFIQNRIGLTWLCATVNNDVGEKKYIWKKQI